MKEIKVSINSILLDVENPRIDPVRAQEEAVVGLMSKGGENKLFTLVEDIMKHGVNPSDILICVEHRIDSGKKIYIAKEGNRRLLALKGIMRPTIFKNAKWRSRMERLLRKYVGGGQASKRIRIQVYADAERDEMKHWIEIKHNGENEGAGTVPWGRQEKLRFINGGRNTNVAVAIIDWLKNDTTLSNEDKEKIKSVPITTFERIVSSVSGRTILGVEMNDGHLQVSRKSEKVKNYVLTIIRDLTTPSPTNPKRKVINVSDVKNIGQIQSYLARRFPDVTEDDRLSEPIQIIVDGNNNGELSSQSVPQITGRTVIGSSIGSQTYLHKRLRLVGVASSNEKIKKMVEELCSLRVKFVPLSFCIVFRSLLDVSMTDYARKNSIPTGNAVGAANSYKALAVECKKKIVTQSAWNAGVPLNWINGAIEVLNGNTLFSITELNNLVHGTMQVPSVENILTYAPRLIPFLIALNNGKPPEEV